MNKLKRWKKKQNNQCSYFMKEPDEDMIHSPVIEIYLSRKVEKLMSVHAVRFGPRI